MIKDIKLSGDPLNIDKITDINGYFEYKVKNSYENNNFIQKFRYRDVTDFERKAFDTIINLIPKNSTILDLGCGSGYPYDSYFINKKFSLTGIDFCEKHIEQAKMNNKTGNYICMNIKDFQSDDKYDLVMALYSIIHIPRSEHKEIFQKVYNFLNHDGIFLLTLRNEDVGDLKYKNGFCDSDMLWSYYDYETYTGMLKEIGFNIIYSEDEKNYGSSESHNWVIMKK